MSVTALTPAAGNRVTVWFVLVGLLVATVAVALTAGRFGVGVGQVFRILLAPLTGMTADWTPTQELVVWTVRLPRIVMAGLAGAGLALSGAVLQGLFRNPLVGPQTIGVSAGAGLGGVIAILLFGFGLPVTLGAFTGGIAALLAVLAIHRPSGPAATVTLVLAGVVVGSLCAALVGFVTFIADPETRLPGIVFWLMGSIAGAGWADMPLIAGCILPAAALLIAMRWRINVLSLGDEEARNLGLTPGRDRVLLLAAICLIVAAQVAVSGAIGWIGLVVPNIMRMVVGADHRVLLPASALAGAVFLIVADTAARSVTGAEIPVGIVTSLVGAPFFAFLLRRAGRSGGRT